MQSEPVVPPSPQPALPEVTRQVHLTLVHSIEVTATAASAVISDAVTQAAALTMDTSGRPHQLAAWRIFQEAIEAAVGATATASIGLKNTGSSLEAVLALAAFAEMNTASYRTAVDVLKYRNPLAGPHTVISLNAHHRSQRDQAELERHSYVNFPPTARVAFASALAVLQFSRLPETLHLSMADVLQAFNTSSRLCIAETTCAMARALTGIWAGLPMMPFHVIVKALVGVHIVVEDSMVRVALKDPININEVAHNVFVCGTIVSSLRAWDQAKESGMFPQDQLAGLEKAYTKALKKFCTEKSKPLETQLVEYLLTLPLLFAPVDCKRDCDCGIATCLACPFRHCSVASLLLLPLCRQQHMCEGV